MAYITLDTGDVLPQEQTESRHYVRSEAVVILDVGGEKFTALRQTLFRFPTSRYIMQSDL